MAENQVLRGMLKNLSAFIGDGIGGTLSKLGWDLNDFNDFVNKAETDTAWESYQRHKRDKSGPGPSAPQSTSGQKRPSEDDPYGLKVKRPRIPNEMNGDMSRLNDGFALILPPGTNVGPNSLYGQARLHENNSLMSDLARGSTSGLFGPSPSAASPGQYTSGSAGSPTLPMAFQPSYAANMPTNADAIQSGPLPLISNGIGGMTVAQTRRASTSQQKEFANVEDPKNIDAFKLVQYVT